MNIIKVTQQFLSGKPKGFYLQLFVKPKSKSEMLEFSEEFIIVKTKAQPIDNAANEDVIRMLSEKLSIDQSSIKIVKGQQSKYKTVFIENEMQAYNKLRN
ncbi:unnamed protein product (macronuclear) [Paramecium tetraurelia]|uniref:Uncharacterized protein n=1 Tax=Paramecium tetraurelia TaxID=5888 RepID=A0C4U4_PARTE|nr:uncharacterized protein GSPATT00006310001 [Paramecium tetraurelia]CAK65811.1 unnamed protein product [Paramecium tetraurelia]|eukprot:XP_001433208.1 hypothetical protein (macronuclear) [Paramecium tetraurelia strain d4-2]